MLGGGPSLKRVQHYIYIYICITLFPTKGPVRVLGTTGGYKRVLSKESAGIVMRNFHFGLA